MNEEKYEELIDTYFGLLNYYGLADTNDKVLEAIKVLALIEIAENTKALLEIANNTEYIG